MPAVSTIVACSAGQWTSIAQYLDARQSLIVQCPELANTSFGNDYQILANSGFAAFLAADPTRVRISFSVPKLDAGITKIWIGPNLTTDGGIAINSASASFPVQYDTGVSQIAGQQWFADVIGGGGATQDIFSIEEYATCPALVLGINKSTAVKDGPYGKAPVGIWTSPDLSSGGSQFRLSRATDYDLVIQEWFAWPIGVGVFSVQVFQAFDVPIEYAPLTVTMPSLSPHGKKAAQDLIDKIQGQVKSGLWLSDDAEF